MSCGWVIGRGFFLGDLRKWLWWGRKEFVGGFKAVGEVGVLVGRVFPLYFNFFSFW